MTEYGCLDCIAYHSEKRTFEADDGDAHFCPYCGNRNFIEAGEEWEEINL